MNKTKIEWVKNPDGTPGYTWNPITGCLNGCEYCYARKLAKGRLKNVYLANKNLAPIYAEGGEVYTKANRMIAIDPFYPRFWVNRAGSPYHHKKPAGIFTCDMSDLFGIGIPQSWQDSVFATIRDNPRHRFYLLTKQPQNLIKFSPFPDNAWVGSTVCTQAMFDRTMDYMVMVEAGKRYLSIEPMQTQIMATQGMGKSLSKQIAFLDWLIIGSQTNPYKPPKWEWVAEVIEACDKAGIPVFLKNNLGLRGRCINYVNDKTVPNLQYRTTKTDYVRRNSFKKMGPKERL